MQTEEKPKKKFRFKPGRPPINMSVERWREIMKEQGEHEMWWNPDYVADKDKKKVN